MNKVRLLLLFGILLALSGAALADGHVVEIEYWQYNFAPRVDAMNALIEQFHEANPDVRVVQNSEFPYPNFRDELAASAPAGVGPDVVTLFYGWIPAFVDAGYLVPLPAEDFPEEWIESHFSPMVAGSKFEGSYWAIPTAVRSLALFWNKDIFEAAGLDPEAPPTTLDEFMEIAIATTTYDGDAEIMNITQQGYAPQLSGQAHHWFREVLLRQYGGVPYNEDNTEVLFDSPEGCEAFAWLASLEIEHKTGSNDLFNGATESFITGTAALHIDGSFRLGAIAKDNPELN